MQLLADQTDDEVVVGLVEPVAGQPHVVRQVLSALGAADAAVLAHDLSALTRIEPLEGTDTP